MSINIYSYPTSPPCRAVLMTAKALDIELNVIDIFSFEFGTYDPGYLKFNACHIMPTINDNGFILWESKAIMHYLINKYAPNSTLYPSDPEERALVDRWLNFDSTVFLLLKYALAFPWFQDMPPKDDLLFHLRDAMTQMNLLVGDKKYLVGDKLTLADIAVLATTTTFIEKVLEFDMSDLGNVNRWAQGMKTEQKQLYDLNVYPGDELSSHLGKAKDVYQLLLQKMTQK